MALWKITTILNPLHSGVSQQIFKMKQQRVKIILFKKLSLDQNGTPSIGLLMSKMMPRLPTKDYLLNGLLNKTLLQPYVNMKDLTKLF